jgi:RNA polymerase sigma-70 factor, ECF subfamily
MNAAESLKGTADELAAVSVSPPTPVVTTTVSQSTYLRDPDVQLMMRVREGDDSAFTKLVQKYQDRLTGVFANMFHDPVLAEDLAQEVFLRIYRARQGYEPTAKFSTWVFQIASNLASNSRRSKGRKKEVQFQPRATDSQPVKAGEQLVPEKSALMPTRQLDRSELQERVQAAMETLSERQRMAILLHKFEGMSYADIGEAMEMSPQAVKSLLSRARENLRIALEQYINSN